MDDNAPTGSAGVPAGCSSLSSSGGEGWGEEASPPSHSNCPPDLRANLCLNPALTQPAAQDQPGAIHTNRFRFELATPADNLELQRFSRNAEMPGAIRFAFDRAPDYFAALRVEGRDSEVLVCREGQSRCVVATSHRSVKSLFLNGQPAPAGYLSALRLEPSVRNGHILARGYAFLRELHLRRPAQLYLTTIMEDNRQAKAALLFGRCGLPAYHDFGRFCCLAISLNPFPCRRRREEIQSSQGEQPEANELGGRISLSSSGGEGRGEEAVSPSRHTVRWQSQVPSSVTPEHAPPLPTTSTGYTLSPALSVRPASAADGPIIVQFLNGEGRSRQFFPEYHIEDFGVPGGLLSHLEWQDVFLAFRGTDLVGVVAAWDQRPLRQWRVTGYAPWLQLLRLPFNLAAKLKRLPPLPKPGSALDYFILSLVCVRNSDRTVFRALLEKIIAARQSQYAFFLAGLHERDPLLPELLARPHVPLPSRLYVVAWEDGAETVRNLDPGLIPYLELGSL